MEYICYVPHKKTKQNKTNYKTIVCQTTLYEPPEVTPVWGEDVEGRGLVTALVHLQDGVKDGVSGHHLLVLCDRAPEGLPHVDVLQ